MLLKGENKAYSLLSMYKGVALHGAKQSRSCRSCIQTR